MGDFSATPPSMALTNHSCGTASPPHNSNVEVNCTSYLTSSCPLAVNLLPRVPSEYGAFYLACRLSLQASAES